MAGDYEELPGKSREEENYDLGNNILFSQLLILISSQRVYGCSVSDDYPE